MLCQGPGGIGKGLLQQLLDLHVHLAGSLLGAVHIGRAVQVAVLGGSCGHEAQLLGHAVLADHTPGQLGGPLEVVGGSGGLHAEDQLLGGPSAH